MEKLPMCRICLAENIRMYIVVNRNLHELYEKLTDIPFVTEDSRPILACFFCCAKLKQCYRLLRQCLEAEELFAQRMNEDYEPNPLMNQDRLELFGGFIKSPTVHISIDDECETESTAIKEELPAVCEGVDDIIEPKEEYQSDELEPENFGNSYLDVADIQLHHSESDLEVDVPLMEFKTEVVEEQVSKKKRRARETTRATIAKKLKLDTQTTKLEDAMKNTRTTPKLTSKPDTYLKESNKCDQRNYQVKKNKQHIRTQIGENPKCDVCQRSFSTKSYLKKHIQIHTGVIEAFKCNVCQRSFTQKNNLSRHIRIHTGEKPYKCDICQRSFSLKNTLINHIRRHTGEKPYKCDVCQRGFSVKVILTNHIRIHTGEKPYKCDICQCSFRTKRDLTDHIRIHTGVKPYKCKVCQHSFNKKGNLRRHILIHTGEKPHKCDICQCSFRANRHLIDHIRIHTGEKPYKCNLCQHCFIKKDDLRKHIRIHTGEKPYKCYVCQRSFSQKGNLRKHSYTHWRKIL